ncbi:MAG TPA: aromatic ring-hydroxylating dioxygenase subunit alpha [Steroidobacteraceae bacterium]|nr:aromatic ring-hydroxylating dioxygenase subunit alpha [Steroidobacteraceae bacterium]
MSEETVSTVGRPRTYQELLARDSREVPESMSKTGVTDVGPLEVPTRWYLDPQIHELEVERIWKRSWQMVCRADDIREVGDTWVYDVASLSYVVVRSASDTIKAFRNSCLHRGRTLRDCAGHTSQLKCPFHGFTWSLDGALLGVPGRGQFPTVSKAEFRLPEAKVGVWGGFVFINPDPNAEPLEHYLGASFSQEFVRSPLDSRAKIAHVSKVMPVNWKVAQDAFLEAFHVHTTHPQWMVAYSDDLHRYDVFGNYSRIIIPGAVPSYQLRWKPTEQQMFNCMVGSWDETPPPDAVPAGADIRRIIADRFREQARPMLGDAVDTYCDAELLDVVMFNIFPNFGPFISPLASLVYTFRPLGNHSDQSMMEVMLLAPWKGEGPAPRLAERRLSDAESFSDVPELGFFGAILNQDTFNFKQMMKGIANNERGKLVLASYHELKLRHFYDVYAKAMGFAP